MLSYTTLLFALLVVVGTAQANSADTTLNNYQTGDKHPVKRKVMNLTQDTFNNIQELALRDVDVAITRAQFDSFVAFSGQGELRIIGGGIASLVGKDLSGTVPGHFSVTADSWLGTTLVGVGNVALTASLYGNDSLQAGSGGAVLTAGLGVNQITGGAGADTIRLLAGQMAAGSNINGGGGMDTLTSTALTTDTLDIGRATVSGVETLSLSAASLRLQAGSLAGFTTVQTGNSAGLMLIGANAGTYSLAGKSLSGVINLTGSSGNDTLIGGSTTQKLFGGAGDDRITYGSTITTIDGGIGNDTLVFNGSGPSTINLANTTIGSTNLAGIESIDTSGITTAVTITGNADANTLKGGTAADTLLGGDGDDTIVYDAVDVLADGGNGRDTLVLNQTVATTVNLATTADQVVGGGTTINFEDVDGTGSTAALTITGDGTANTLKGGTAADTISGGAGNDIIEGGGGADSLYGNAGDDTLTYHAGATRFEGGAGSDTLFLPAGVIYDLANATNQVSGSTIVTGFEQVIIMPATVMYRER